MLPVADQISQYQAAQKDNDVLVSLQQDCNAAVLSVFGNAGAAASDFVSCPILVIFYSMFKRSHSPTTTSISPFFYATLG